MKVISIAAAGVTLALIALTLVPGAGEHRPYLAIGAMIGAAATLTTILVGWRKPAGAFANPQVDQPARAFANPLLDQPAIESPRVRSVAQAVTDVGASRLAANGIPPALKPISADADVVGFLATFQEKGRLVDFLQDDITGYSDAQVGAAARVVHQGCKAVLNDYFRIVPVREEREGTKVTVPADYVADEYRLVGKISGQAPFSGLLVHRGWKVQSVNLPRVLHRADDRFPTIAPAEVELR